MGDDAEPDRRADPAGQPEPGPEPGDDAPDGDAPRLTDEERRRHAAFVAEVFGRRCGDRC